VAGQTILPDSDKLITEKEWVALVEKHGSEDAVVKVLDCDDWRYEAAGVSDARS
jgi:hypothetical protein